MGVWLTDGQCTHLHGLLVGDGEEGPLGDALLDGGNHRVCLILNEHSGARAHRADLTRATQAVGH